MRGHLEVTAKGPALKTTQGLVLLEGDEPTLAVLRDSRLTGADFEIRGRRVSPALFRVDPIHTKALFVHRNGRKLLVSYWCDVCYIRTYSPGKCWCCQEETKLDLIDPAAIDPSEEQQAPSK